MRRKSLLCFFAFVSLLTLLSSCSNDTGPISGCYKIKGQEKYAVVIDSTLYLLCGFDSMFTYDLKLNGVCKFNDTTTARLYCIVYSNSLNREGYKDMLCPLKFDFDENFGGLPVALFTNNTSLIFGGYDFEREKDSAKFIFDKWTDLMTNNTQSKLNNYLNKN